jgi:hypothetical protein
MLGRVLGMLGCVNAVTVGQMRVVCSRFVVAALVMLGGFFVVARSVFMMFRRLRMVLSCFV